MLYCEHCKSKNNDIVIDSDYTDYYKIIGASTRRRRRMCNNCKKRWTTLEINSSELEKIIGFNVELYFLGTLCVNRHKYKETGLSLRYRTSKRCIECVKKRR